MTQDIETRTLGKTGEQVTVLGLGGSGFRQCSFADAVATVRRALDLGITYFDTARVYWASERIIGEALRGRSEQVVVATKVGHFADAGAFRSAQALRAQIQESREALGRERLDLLQVHECEWRSWWSDHPRPLKLPPEPDEVVDPDEAYDFASAPVVQVLREAVEEGTCRFVGVTGTMSERTAHVLRHVDVDAVLVAGQYDLVWRPMRRDTLPIARSKGTAVILGSPLRIVFGLDTFNDRMFIEPHPEWLESPPPWMTPEVRSSFARLYEIQRDCGLSLVELSLRFLVGDPDVTSILTGAATPAEVEQNVAIVAKGPLPPDLHQAIDDIGV